MKTDSGQIHLRLSLARMPQVDARRWAAGIAAVAAAWMVIVSTRYVALGLSDIRGGLGAGFDEGSWISTVYAAGDVTGVVFGCWLAESVSVRRVFLCAASLFTLLSTLPLLQPTLTNILVVRLFQGIAGGALLPMAIIGLQLTLPRNLRAVAVALYTSASTLAPQTAAGLTGWLLENGGWRALFWANLPIGLVALSAGAYGFPKSDFRPRSLLTVDRFELLALVIGLALVATVFDQGNRLDWWNSWLVRGLSLAGTAALVSYVVCAISSKRSYLFRYALLNRRNISLGALGAIPFAIAGLGCGYLIPEYLVEAHGYRPENIGPILGDAAWPQIVSYCFGVICLTKQWVSPRILLLTGFLAAAGGLLHDSLGLYGVWIGQDLLLGQVLQGIGLPLILLPILFLFVSDVVPREGLQAALLFNVFRSLGGTIGLGLIETLDRVREQLRSNILVDHVVAGGNITSARLSILTSAVGARSIGSDQAASRALGLLASQIQNQAQILGHADTLAVLGAIMLMSAVLAFCLAPAGSGLPIRR
jgi:MFS transporter, DHA2 family, multidrug resistance protein